VPAPRDAVIIGAGLNGLVCARRLAEKGLKPLVLDRREVAGGQCVTEEFAPGFRCSAVYDSGVGVLPGFAMRMTHLLALSPDGRALRLRGLHDDPASIAPFSRRDADRFPEFLATFTKVCQVLGPLFQMTPPDIDAPSAGELWELAKAGRRFRKLGDKEMFRLLRWAPMAAADLVGEMFDTELLRAALAARGCFGTALGPWSAGTGAVMLLQAAACGTPLGPMLTPALGGMGAYSSALAAAAQKAGAEIRTGAEVAQILVKDGRAAGVALASGEEIPARAVVSAADPRQTLLRLTDQVHLDPGFVAKIRNYRCAGTVARVHLALDGLPEFRDHQYLSGGAPGGDGAHPLAGARIHIGHELDYLERAFDHSKYGEFSSQPYLEAFIPTLLDPSLAPAGSHVMSVHAQYAPFTLRAGDWDSRGDALGNAVVRALADYFPDLPEKILHRRVITPLDLEKTYGLTGGHLFHGELALDQLFTMRPVIGWARYRTPLEGLWLCGAGTHPGVGFGGESGRNAAREILKSLR